LHGIVLLNGMRDKRVPPALRQFVDREYEHYLGGTHGTVTIARLVLEQSMAPGIAFVLADELEPTGYYARLNDTSIMFVAYPGAVVRIDRSEPASAEVARAVGRLFLVEASHMRFEEMFELDHPEMHPDTDAERDAG